MLPKGLLWIPADLPRYADRQMLVDNYVQEYKNSAVARAFGSQQFTEAVENYAQSQFKESYRSTHQSLFDYLDQHMPFDHLVNIKIHRQLREGRAHIDFLFPENNPQLYENNNSNEPCGYRMVIAGVRQGQLYIDKSNGERVFPTLPETTDWYILGHTTALHGLKGYDDTGRHILFCHAWINAERHSSILQNSLAKYSDYAVWDL
jgi:hypothetical protein